ncbi:hypothetical protein AK812_SmicGene12216 [Symbiodinium microadriaticum]|uniref:Uncharacterized protein n=1 Tax=Symbiodinium microadriaticum TaxID=2951 RepID=A0A1Q9EB87_SYMMI|nr:hypothetical protein AK812_SmicGene12216 [Symbiodinium microadriaticum]
MHAAARSSLCDAVNFEAAGTGERGMGNLSSYLEGGLGSPRGPAAELEEGTEAPAEDASRCFWIFACTMPGGRAEEDAGAFEPVAEPPEALAEVSEAPAPLTAEHRPGFL